MAHASTVLVIYLLTFKVYILDDIMAGNILVLRHRPQDSGTHNSVPEMSWNSLCAPPFTQICISTCWKGGPRMPSPHRITIEMAGRCLEKGPGRPARRLAAAQPAALAPAPATPVPLTLLDAWGGGAAEVPPKGKATPIMWWRIQGSRTRNWLVV